MRKWTFFARITPERVPVTCGAPLQGTAYSAALNINYDFRVAVNASQAIVDITVEDEDLDLPSLRNLADFHIRTVTDLAGYMHALCFDVEVIAAVCQDTNEWQMFGIEIPVLAERRKGEKLDELRMSLLSVIGANPAAQFALADFRESMRVPVNTGFYCYRAIEAMMQSMKKAPDDVDAPAWQLLRERLCVDRSAIDEIKKHADLPRHGKPSNISDAERSKVFVLTDEIMKRYLQYLEQGFTPLTELEFSTLKV